MNGFIYTHEVSLIGAVGAYIGIRCAGYEIPPWNGNPFQRWWEPEDEFSAIVSMAIGALVFTIPVFEAFLYLWGMTIANDVTLTMAQVAILKANGHNISNLM